MRERERMNREDTTKYLWHEERHSSKKMMNKESEGERERVHGEMRMEG